jgi:hypothetical protein
MFQELERGIAPVTRNTATCHRSEYSAHPCASDIPLVGADLGASARNSTMTPANRQRCVLN